MSFPLASWLKTMMPNPRRARRNNRRTAVRAARPTRLSVESLESRLVPSTLIDNATVTVLPSSTVAFPGYSQADSLDAGPGQDVTDYASWGQGSNTHLDYQFPAPENFTEIVYTNRTTSGGANGGFVGGTYDYVYQYEYIFSNDPSFATSVGVVTVNRPNPGNTVLNGVANFQSHDAIPDITAQYVRWQVLASNGSNPGAADFEFYTGSPPTVAVDVPAVSANEGSAATNTGTFHDADGNGTVTVSASVGTVTQDNSTGTWSWSLNVADGPAGPFPVTITATDDQGTAAHVTFTYAVNNVPPTVALGGDATAAEGSPYTLNLGAVTDPGQDTITGYTIDWGDGVIDTVTGSPANTTATHTFDDGPAGRTVNVTVSDEDGTFLAGSLGVQVLNAAPTAVLQTNDGVVYGNSATATLSSPFDPSTADTAAGLHYAFSLDTDTTGAATYASTAGSTNSVDFGVLDAGTHTVYARVIDKDGGYTAYSASLRVNRAPSATTTLGDGPFTYDGTTHAGGSGTVTGAGGLSTGATSLTYTGDQIDAGIYYVTAHYAGDANHLPSDGDPVAITINKAPSTTTTVGDGPFTYDGTAHAGGSGTVTGAGGLSASATVTYTGDQTDAGTYYVTAHYAGDANHLPSDGDPVAIVISPKRLEASAWSQRAITIGSNDSIVLHLAVAPGQLYGTDTVASLFSGVTFTIAVQRADGSVTYETRTSKATIQSDGSISVSLQMNERLRAELYDAYVNGGGANFNISATAKGGNYSIVEDIGGRTVRPALSLDTATLQPLLAVLEGVGTLNFSPAVRTWLAMAPRDLRKGFDALAELLSQHLRNDRLSGPSLSFAIAVATESSWSVGTTWA